MRVLRGSLMAAVLLTATPTLAQAEDYTVGLLLPYSGVYAALGEEIDSGFTLALEQRAGEIPEAEITIVREDTEVKPPIALSKTRKLVLQDEVDVLVGVVSSGVLGAMRDFVHQSGTPLIVANAGNDDATGKRGSPYITRLSFSNSQVSRPMGSWMAEQGIESVFTLAPDYAAGHQMINAFTEAFEDAGGKVVGQDFTPFQNTKDFGPYLTTARASGADAIFAFYAGGEAISFVKQYESFGLAEDVPLHGTGFLTSSLYVEAQGSAAEGVITSLHYAPAIATAENQAFVEAFSAAHGRLPSEYAVQGYDAGQALVEAIKSGATDRASLATALSEVQFTSPRGPVAIDPATNNIVQNIYIYKTVAGDAGMTQKILGVVEAVRDPAQSAQAVQ